MHDREFAWRSLRGTQVAPLQLRGIPRKANVIIRAAHPKSKPTRDSAVRREAVSPQFGPEREARKQSSRQRQSLASSTQHRKLTKRQEERVKSDPPQRLAKVIANAGIASRRKAEDIVLSGAVKVNGKPVTLPQHMVIASIDQVTVDGKQIPRSSRKYYFALNKPKGFLCASSGGREPGRQRLVVDLLRAWTEGVWREEHPSPHAVAPRLFTVGRLDVQTTGLIFVTNDGEWAQSVQHPSSNLTKEYVVTLPAAPTAQQLDAVAAGCVVDGAFVRPRSVSFAAPDRRDKLRVVVAEGRNREVRVLVETAGLSVRGLKRVRVGGFRLPSDLSVGEFRELKPRTVMRVTDKSFESNPQTNHVLGL